MVRQSISITTPNDNWLNALVASEEYASKSEAVNDLIRKERAKQEQIEAIRAKLIAAEQSGFTNLTAAQIREEAKEELRRNGKL